MNDIYFYNLKSFIQLGLEFYDEDIQHMSKNKFSLWHKCFLRKTILKVGHRFFSINFQIYFCRVKASFQW